MREERITNTLSIDNMIFYGAYLCLVLSARNAFYAMERVLKCFMIYNCPFVNRMGVWRRRKYIITERFDSEAEVEGKGREDLGILKLTPVSVHQFAMCYGVQSQPSYL